jgi:hypothetical protein
MGRANRQPMRDFLTGVTCLEMPHPKRIQLNRT